MQRCYVATGCSSVSIDLCCVMDINLHRNHAGATHKTKSESFVFLPKLTAGELAFYTVHCTILNIAHHHGMS